MRTSDVALSVRDLHAFYGRSHILWDVTLDVHKGEVIALLGRNGAGKTTTINSIFGLLRPRQGEIVLNGRNVSRLPSHKRVAAGLGIVPSGGRLFGSLSVRENLEIVRGRAQPDGMSVEDVFELFPRLGEFPNRLAGALSGGERQMLAFGRALLTRPDVLLLDEPSEGLAPIIVNALSETIGLMRDQGVSVLLSEQNHRFAFRVADRAYVIEKGRIRHSDTTTGFMASGAINDYLGV